LCKYSQEFPSQWAPNDCEILENGDAQTFPLKFLTVKRTLFYSNKKMCDLE